MIRRRRPRLLDCRRTRGRMSSLSWSPRNNGLEGTVTAHEGTKPNVGDYLAMTADGRRGDALYRVVEVDWCHNVDPANMWIAHVEFVPGRVARTLTDLPTVFHQ